MLGLWEEGIPSFLFAEGGYNTRMDTVADMPKYSTMWLFDKTDMRLAKKCLEGNALIQGNVPASLMSTGSVDQLRAYCEDLLTLFAGSPGFILANGAGVETTTDEHVRTMINIVRE
jgi:uroporphyrinogen-III decarboxylase